VSSPTGSSSRGIDFSSDFADTSPSRSRSAERLFTAARLVNPSKAAVIPGVGRVEPRPTPAPQGGLMSFAEAAKARSTWKPRTPCKVGVFLNTLPADVAADIEAAFADKSITSTAIEEELAHRYPHSDLPGRSSVARHRRRYGPSGDRCACG
jgi:hypothetical protein